MRDLPGGNLGACGVNSVVWFGSIVFGDGINLLVVFAC